MGCETLDALPLDCPRPSLRGTNVNTPDQPKHFRVRGRLLMPFAIFVAVASPGAALSAPANGVAMTDRYPTADEAFYVLSCMETNGQNAEGLRKCSCAVNALESRLPWPSSSSERGTDGSTVVNIIEPVNEDQIAQWMLCAD